MDPCSSYYITHSSSFHVLVHSFIPSKSKSEGIWGRRLVLRAKNTSPLAVSTERRERTRGVDGCRLRGSGPGLKMPLRVLAAYL